MADDYPATLDEALARFQAEIPDVVKAETAKVTGESKDGRPVQYTYTYADLAACTKAAMPLLGKFGLSFSSKPTLREDGQFVLVYKLRHVSKESDGGDYPLPDPIRTKPQAIGSAITYARRYAFCSVTGLAPKDDDDAAAADADKEPPAPARRSEQQTRASTEQERPADPEDVEVENGYVRRIDDADSRQALTTLFEEIPADPRLARGARARLREKFDGRWQALAPSSNGATQPETTS